MKEEKLSNLLTHMKRRGERIAPLMTLEQMEIQLINMKKFTVEEL